MTTFQYFYEDPENEFMRREGSDGSIFSFGAVETNRMYVEFLASGATAAEYVAPPAPTLTTEEKVNRLLSDYGLTRDEMSAALAAE